MLFITIKIKIKILQLRHMPFTYNTDVYILCDIVCNFVLSTLLPDSWQLVQKVRNVDAMPVTLDL